MFIELSLETVYFKGRTKLDGDSKGIVVVFVVFSLVEVIAVAVAIAVVVVVDVEAVFLIDVSSLVLLVTVVVVGAAFPDLIKCG